MRVKVAVFALVAATLSMGFACPRPQPQPTPTPTATLTPTPEPTVPPTPTPTPTPTKLLLHYYNDDNARYGRDEQAVALRTSARLDRFGAIRDAGDASETDEVLVARMAEVLDRIPRGMPIVVGLDYRWVSSGSDGGLRVVGLIFQMIKDRGRWDDVLAIEVCDEPSGGITEVEADCQDINGAVANLGLAPKSLAITFTEESIIGKVASRFSARGLPSLLEAEGTVQDYVAGPGMLAGRAPKGMTRAPRVGVQRRGLIDASLPGWMAPSLKIAVFELYAPLQLAWSLDEVVAGWPLVSADRQISTVRASRPDMMFAFVIMGYGRNYDGLDRLGWRNMHTLALINQQSFVALEGRNVLWAAIFSCGRETCTCDQKNPQVGQTLRPIHTVARARIDNPSVQWPPLPRDPMLKFPTRLAPRSIYLKQRNGDSADVGEARRWGVIVINKLRVFGQCKGTTVECECDDPAQFYGKKVAKWTISGGGQLSDQHYNETQGWAQAVTIGDTPVGSKIVVTASLLVGTHTSTWRGEWTVKPAGYVSYGKCDGGVEKKPHQRVPIWVNDATGEARCAKHGGAW